MSEPVIEYRTDAGGDISVYVDGEYGFLICPHHPQPNPYRVVDGYDHYSWHPSLEEAKAEAEKRVRYLAALSQFNEEYVYT